MALSPRAKELVPAPGGVSLPTNGPCLSRQSWRQTMELEAASTEELWLRAVSRSTPSHYPVFGGSFNIEYWSAELFAVQKDPHKKIFQVLREEGRVGKIEV